MSAKRGQITLFVVVAILIVAAVAIVVVVRPSFMKPVVSSEEAQKIISSQTQPVLDTTQRCIADTANLFLDKIGYQAGYYYYSHLKTITGFAGIKVVAVYKDSAGIMINKIPSFEDINEEFDRFMNTDGYAYLDNCTKDFQSFKKTLDNVEQNKAQRSIKLKLFEDYALINSTWNLDLIRSEAKTSVSPEKLEIPTQLGKLIRVAQDIATKEVEGTAFMRGEVTGDYILSNNLLVRNIQMKGTDYPDNDHTLILLTGLGTRVGEKDTPFHFAIARV